MDLSSAQCEIDRRFYAWIKTFVRREVTEDFPALEGCQHNRRVRCFITWMRSLTPEERLIKWHAIASSVHDCSLATAEGKPFAPPEVFEERDSALHDLHLTVPPTTDTDRYSAGFVRASPLSCRDSIIERLEPICGRPRRRQPQKVWYVQRHGDWELTTHFEIRRLLGPTVDCYHFLRRADSPSSALREYRLSGDDLITRIDPLILSGVAWSQFPLIGKSHEQLRAQSVFTVTALITAAVPQIVAGLGIDE
jgi:hypothetical protein